MPTPVPGCQVVPRWRMMMLPATTFSPPKAFTPSRRPAVSRPLRDEPPAFLWAMGDYSLSVLGFRGLAGAFLGFVSAAAASATGAAATAASGLASALASGFALALADGLAPPVRISV